MQSERALLGILVLTLDVALAGCGSRGEAAGSGGAAVQPTTGGAGGTVDTGGSGSGGVLSNGGKFGGGGTLTAGNPGTGGRFGSGGRTTSGSNASGGTSATTTAAADASASWTGDGSAGCGLSGAPTGSLSSQTILVGDRTRTYALTVPKNYTPSTPLPVVFAWHGMGGSGSVARSYFRLDTTIANKAIVVYPDGLPVGDGGTGWDLTANGIDVAFFDALFAYVSNTYCIDRNRVFTTGHSYGGFFTNILGCYRGDVLRATAPVAGMPPSAYGRGTVTCSGKVAALIIHGSNDPTVDYTRGGIGGRDFWTAQNGCSTSDPVEIAPPGCLEYQNCQPDLPVVFCTHTEQHNWPTANAAGCSDGGVCFDAASVIWTFFSRFQ
jgi:poly(3-hydroxybutyrate) depolymerase